MKKNNYLFLGLAGLVLASCSQEDLMNPSVNPDGTANITLNLSTPGIGTRYSEGTGATKLQYAVYEVFTTDGKETLRYVEGLSRVDDGNGNDNSDYISLNKQLTMKLVTDHDYRLVFWAGHPENTAYSIKWNENAAPVMTVDYDQVKANDETLDGFFKSVDLTVNGDVTMSVELKRPFAQINVGTSDYEAFKLSGCEPDFSNIKVSTCYNSLDLMTGQAKKDETTNSSTYADNNIAGRPSATASATAQSFPVTGYDYLAMAYVLVPMYEEDPENKDKTMNEVVEVYFGYNDKTNLNEASDKHNRTVGSVPLKRNYRTNIYGEILTGTANLNVEIVPDYEDDLTIDQLIFAAQVGGTVVLQDDVVIDWMEGRHGLVFTQDAVVDLNNKTVSGNKEGLFMIENGANLTVKGNGRMVVNKDHLDERSTAIWVTEGTLTIEGGWYETPADGQLIYCGGTDPLHPATVNVKGGYFKNTNPEAYGWALNLDDKSYRQGYSKFVVTGGYFYKFDPSNSACDLNADGTHANWVPEGYEVVKTTVNGEEDWYTVVKKGTVVAKDNDELVAALAEGATEITLTPGTYTAESFKNDLYHTGMAQAWRGFNKDVTLYANGVVLDGTFTCTFGGATIVGMTFKNSDTSKNAMYGGFDGKFVDCTFEGGVWSEIKNGKAEFDNCTFICEDTARMACHLSEIYANNVVNLNNCVIKGRCDFGNAGTLNFNECKMTVLGNEWGLYGVGKYVFNNCTIDDSSKIKVKTTATVEGL